MTASVISELSKVLGGFSIIVIAIVWLAKAITSQVLSKDIENYKTSLKARSDFEIEKLKDDLKRAAFVRETRFSHLHGKVAAAIENVTPPLIELADCVAAFLSHVDTDGVSKEDKATLIVKASVKFNDCYVKNQICLPPRVNAMIHDLSNVLFAETKMFSLGRDLASQGIRDPGIPNYWERAMKANEQINVLFRALTEEMQKVLGFESYENPDSNIEKG